MDTKSEIDKLTKVLCEEPGNIAFVDLAFLLSDIEERRAEAREICFRGLTQHPRNAKGRLVLARLFYLDGYYEFAVRELDELRKYTNISSVDRLIEAFGPFAEQVLSNMKTGAPEGDTDRISGSEVLAEVEFDAEFDDVLDELDEID